ncbi:MAG: hypothetical protein E7673_05200 [Ruminococcaceae bacterium]|nr:hypothetical protein [Oscillospiraceae bacterium]
MKKCCIRLIKLLIKILPLSFWLVLIFAFDKPYVAILTLISALAHELGHVFAFTLYSGKYRFFGVISGLRLSMQNSLSYKEELIISLSGPLTNVAIFLLVSPFSILGVGEYARIFGLINLFTAVSNLVPIEGYDGYRIIECFLNQYTSFKPSGALLRSASFLLSAVFCLTALYLIRSFDGGYWIFFIFLASLFKAICCDTSVFEKKRGKKSKKQNPFF